LGTPVNGVSDGRVLSVVATGKMSYQVVLSHGNGWVSVYGNVNNVTHRTGDLVFAGDVLGTIGQPLNNSKIPHLHFELWHSGQPVNPASFFTAP